MAERVIDYVLRRLKDIGVDTVFGVPGDFAFTVQDAIVAAPGLRWVGCCNELNAGYAADGYARLRGIGALSTTYGVGELSAINAVAGSYAENLPIFHLTGMPTMAAQRNRSLVHHTLGNGEFDLFHRMAQPVVCASAIMTPHNVAYETERLIAAALYHRRPVYMAFPSDLATADVVRTAQPIAPPSSSTAQLTMACDAIVSAVSAAPHVCVLPGMLAARAGIRDLVERFIDASKLPFATMFADKSVLDEQHPSYVGIYDGALADRAVRDFVESRDLVILIGSMMTDFNTGAFTAHLDPARTIDIGHHVTTVVGRVFHDVEMADVVRELTGRIRRSTNGACPRPSSLGSVVGGPNDPITAAALYPRWEKFFAPGDVIIAETGTVSMGLALARLPRGATFHNQTLWGSIGWATPATLGAQIASPTARVVLVTGEGSHQLTAQEISQFGRRGLKPIIFVLNNGGYLIERLLCKDPGVVYNDVASWNYAELPRALGCVDWFTARVTRCGELDDALTAISRQDRAAYVEVVTPANEAPELAKQLHRHLASLYRT